MIEDEMAGWHHQPDGHEFEQTLGARGGQGSPACCSPWGCRVRHDLVTEQQLKTLERYLQEFNKKRLHPSIAFWTLLLTIRASPFLLRDSYPQ